MRLYVVILFACLIFFVFVESQSSKVSNSKSSPSKTSGSKSSGSSGKVVKNKRRPHRHDSSDSSDSSDDFPHKEKKKLIKGQVDKESFHGRKRQRHNTTRHSGGVDNKMHQGKDNFGKLNNVNSSKYNDLQSFLQMEKDSNQYFKNQTGIKSSIGFKNSNRTITPIDLKHNATIMPPTGFKNNVTVFLIGFKKNNESVLPIGFKNNSGTIPPINIRDKNKTLPSIGFMNNTGTVSPIGFKDIPLTGFKNNTGIVLPMRSQNNNGDKHSIGFKNHTAAVPSIGFKNHSESIPSTGSKTNAETIPLYQTKFFSYGSKPNSIIDNGQPGSYIQTPGYSEKSISNVGNEYGWGNANPAPPSGNFYNNLYVPNEKMYPINVYEKKDKSSSKFFKHTGKAFGKISKAIGKGLSNDIIKEAASSYFSNPPPAGWIYNPPQQNSKMMHYGPVLKPNSREKLSVDDWRSLIFGNVPMKVDTGQLYSALFPEIVQDLNLEQFSGRGNLPYFNQTKNKLIFSPPQNPKLFAGLYNEALRDVFRDKRELSAQGKTMADVINKFLINERDCNDTYLEAKRKKRQLVIKPLTKSDDGRNENEKIISNFPFSGVEAIVQSEHDISVFGGIPESLPEENSFSRRKSSMKEGIAQDTDEVSNTSNSGMRNDRQLNFAATESVVAVDTTTKNTTKLYPVSETIKQFLEKKPVTQLTVVKESLDRWKSIGNVGVASDTPSRLVQGLGSEVNEQRVNLNSWKRLTRSENEANEHDVTSAHFGVSGANFQESSENLGSDSSTSLDHDSNETYTLSPIETFSPSKYDSNDGSSLIGDVIIQTIDNLDSSSYTNSIQLQSKDYPSKVTSALQKSTSKNKRKGFYFFGVYISDYENVNHWSHLDSTPVPSTNSFPETSYMSTQHTYAHRTASDNIIHSVQFSEKSGRKSSGKEGASVTPTGVGHDAIGSTLTGTITKILETTTEPVPSNPTLAYEVDSPTNASSKGPSSSVKGAREHFSIFPISRTMNDYTPWPFKINSIMPYSNIGINSFDKAEPNRKAINNGYVSVGEVLIQAPLKSCGPNQRLAKGRCRSVWGGRI